MNDPEVAKLEPNCEELRVALDKIKPIVWEPKTTLPAVKRKMAIRHSEGGTGTEKPSKSRARLHLSQ